MLSHVNIVSDRSPVNRPFCPDLTHLHSLASLNVQGQRQLESMDGKLEKFLEKTRANSVQVEPTEIPLYFLAIDGGGTKCKVAIATSTAGVVARASSGACNVNSVSVDQLIERIQLATMDAIQQIPSHHRSNSQNSQQQQQQQQQKMLPFVKVWAGLAGFLNSNNREAVQRGLEKTLSVSSEKGSLILTSDDALLGSCISDDRHVESGIVVIAGTGAVATAFRKSTTLAGQDINRIARSGGWGFILGDPGSAFDIGRRAVQAVLADREQRQGDGVGEIEPTALEQGIIRQLGCKRSELLPCILRDDGGYGQQPKHRVATLAHVVTSLGFRDEDEQALAILRDAARSVAQCIRPLTKSQISEPGRSVLVLGGGLMQVAAYQKLVLKACEEEGVKPFKKVVAIDDASALAAEYIARYPKRIHCNA